VQPAPPPSKPAELVREPAVQIVRASPAPVWRRLGAWLVDGLAVGALVAVYVVVAQSMMKHPPPPTLSTDLDWLVNRGTAYRGLLLDAAVLGAALVLVYGSVLHALRGQTLGKMLFGIRLVDRGGGPPALWVCVLRGLISLISLAALGLGFLLVPFARRRRALHDLLSATCVVRLLGP